MFRTLDELPAGQRILLRVDLNSPVEDGRVRDNKRFERHTETVRELSEADHRIVILAHQGRPNRDSFVSLEQHADILSTHLDQSVTFVDDVFGEDAIEAIDTLPLNGILMLENVRTIDAELADRTPESHAKSRFVQTLAPHFDAFVNDAYSTAHRVHASTVGFPLVMPAFAGRVMETEYRANSSIQSRLFDGPVTMILGGTKVADLLSVLHRVESKVDTVCLGGVIGELFLRARSHDLGYDVDSIQLYDDQWETHRDDIEDILANAPYRFQLPEDLAFQNDDSRMETDVAGVEKSVPFLDIGSATIDAYTDVVEESAAVFVKGALGKFEDERFSHGTVSLLERIASTDAFSVIGGGDTAWAIDRYGLTENDYSHVSIAGGAYVRALAGETLPAIEVLVRSTE